MRRIDGRWNAGLAAALRFLEERLGEGAVMLLGGDAPAPQLRGIATGSRALDEALGGQGWPRGRISDLYGAESSGKTTLALHALAEAQREGGVAAYVDVDRGLDLAHAARLGVRPDRLVLAEPSSSEEAFVIVSELVRSGGVDLVVVDSTAGLLPRSELAAEIDAPYDPAAARLGGSRVMAAALKRLQPLVASTSCAVLFVSQLRGRVDDHGKKLEYVAGGGPLLFHAAARVELQRERFVEERGAVVGAFVRAVVVKNKLAPPYQEARFTLRFGQGIVPTAAVVAEAA